MQSASSNFAAAVSASSGVWAGPQVHADWANDGYGGDNSIDDLTPLAGRPISVNQALDDGMPSDVSLTSGVDPTSKADMPVGGKVVGGLFQSGPQYWSLDNTASPISAYDRDVAAVTVAHGLVGAGGIERVTVFTGQMSDAPVTSRDAVVQAVSKTRLAMTRPVQAPPIVGDWLGLDATWPVSWALYQCGIYVSPPPRSGCRLWMPMHGSVQPHLPAIGRKVISSTVRDSSSNQVRPTFVDGPYLAAVNLARTATGYKRLNYPYVPVASGTDLLTTTANAGRIEFWVRGDATDSTGSPNHLAGLYFSPQNGVGLAWGGVGTDRKVFINVNDNAGHNITLKSTATLPTDGNWYFVGAAYDVAHQKLWVVNNFGGSNVVETSTPAFVTTGLPAQEVYATDDLGIDGSLTVEGVLPFAEVHLTSGVQANPDNYVWLNDPSYTWTAGAVVGRSELNMFGIAEQTPTEAWAWIASFAQAELAMIRTDELDRFCYFPPSYWAATAQQTVADTWSTSVNAGDFTPTRDLTKIRNQVAVTYTDARLGQYLASQNDSVYVDFTQHTLLPGTTTLTLTFGSPVARVDYVGNPFPTSRSFLLIDNTTTTPPVRNYLAANTAADGSGSWATTGQLAATITSWDAGKAVVSIVNTTGSTFYTIHPTLAYLQIAGTFLTLTNTATVTVQDTPSVSARGVRGLAVSLAPIQDSATATRIGYELLSRSLKARPQLAVTLQADPRRQPGDLVTFTDPGNTQASGTWRSMAVGTTIDGASATQQVVAVKADLVGVWDSSNWDDCVWGP